jgi:hypothetical protein
MELAFVRSRAWNRPAEPGRTRQSDPVLGRLKWDGVWQRSVKDSAFGKRVALSVEVFDDGGEPSEEQRLAFTEYRRVEEKVFPQVERMLFEYYWANREQLGSYAPAIRGSRKRLPDLKKPGDIWRLAKAETVLVPIQEKKKGRVVMLDFKTVWDQEHATRVLIRTARRRG